MTSPRVLLVEDDTFLRRVLAREVARVTEVVSVGSGSEAVDVFSRQGPFAVVMSDLMLPGGVSGVDVLRTVHGASPQTVGVAMSGKGSRGDLLELINEAKIWKFLDKPCRGQIVRQTVEAALVEFEARGRGMAAAADGSSGPAADRGAAEVARELAQLARKLDVDTLRLPALDPTAAALPKLLSDPDVSVEEVVSLVSRDPVLVTELLRRANTVRFGARQRMNNVRDACKRLGTRRVAALAQAVTLQRSFKPTDRIARDILQNYWQHTVDCAAAASDLARGVDIDGDGVYLAALLHNLGELVLVNATPDLAGGSLPHEDWVDVAQVIHKYHQAVGELVLRHWEFPTLCTRMAADHHIPHLAAMFGSDDKARRCIRAADALALRKGGAYMPGAEVPELEDVAMETGFSVADLEAVAP